MMKKPNKKNQHYHDTPFGPYFKILDRIDKGKRYSKNLAPL
jgi:hypothetical protein